MDYPQDCIRICKVALDHGYYITPLEAQKIWEIYSDSMCASWLILPTSDEDLWFDIRRVFNDST